MDAPKAAVGRRLVTVKKLSSVPGYEWLTVSALRHLIFQAEDRFCSTGQVIKGNGLSRAIIRVGRKVLIDLDEFDRWIERHRVEGPVVPGDGEG